MKLNPGLGPQAQHLADPANLALLEDEIAQRATGHRFEFFTDRHVGPLQRDRRVAGLLHADPEADVEEVGVAGTALPHPRAADHGVEILRIAVHEQLAASLFLSGALDLVAILVELAQIASVAAFPVRPRRSADPGRTVR